MDDLLLEIFIDHLVWNVRLDEDLEESMDSSRCHGHVDCNDLGEVIIEQNDLQNSMIIRNRQLRISKALCWSIGKAGVYSRALRRIRGLSRDANCEEQIQAANKVSIL